MQRPAEGAPCEYLEPAYTGTVALDHAKKKNGTSSQSRPS